MGEFNTQQEFKSEKGLGGAKIAQGRRDYTA